MVSTFDEVRAPADYDELHRYYFGYMVQFVKHQGIEPQSAEDVASEIMFRLIATDILSQFDAGMTFERGGEVKTARFKSFLNSKLIAYVKHHRERQTVRRTREPVICDTPVGEDDTWIQVFGPSMSDDYAYLEEQELVASIRSYLVTVKPRSSKDICDLPKLFDAVVAQVRLTGRVSTPELQELFGISATATHAWLKRLRAHVKIALGG